MSQNFDTDGETQIYGRGRRKKYLSQRVSDAQEDGSVIPGISPERALASSSFEEPQAIIAPQTIVAPPTVRKIVTPVKTMPSLKSKSPGRAEKYGLGSDKFAIYSWQPPRPKDFTDLDSRHRSWKSRQDKVEKDRDDDQGQDDWSGFDNDLSNRGIASAFMKRAKRAFWAGKSWHEFEESERSITPMTLDMNGKEVTDPNALDNDRRMEIFEAIATRLCEEIWLEEYVAREPASRPPHESIAARTGNVRSDTPMLTTIEERQPTKEESAEGIIKLTKTAQGDWEPWYEGEVVNPSGIARAMQAFRDDRAQKSQAVSVTDDTDSECDVDIVAYM